MKGQRHGGMHACMHRLSDEQLGCACMLEPGGDQESRRREKPKQAGRAPGGASVLMVMAPRTRCGR